MSQENVEAVREQFEALLDAVNARDFDSLAELIPPEAEFGSVLAVAEGAEAYTGIDGLRKWAEQVDAIWEDWHQEVVDFREVSDTRPSPSHARPGRRGRAEFPSTPVPETC